MSSMSHEQWVGETNPEIMLEHLRDKISPRKLQLFVCACWRRVLPFLDERAFVAVGEVEQFLETGPVPEVNGDEMLEYANHVPFRGVTYELA